MAPVTEAVRKERGLFSDVLRTWTFGRAFVFRQCDSRVPDGDVSRIVAGSFCLNIELSFGVRLCRGNPAREWAGGADHGQQGRNFRKRQATSLERDASQTALKHSDFSVLASTTTGRMQAREFSEQPANPKMGRPRSYADTQRTMCCDKVTRRD